MTTEQADQHLIDFPMNSFLIGYFKDMDGDIHFGSCVCVDQKTIEEASKKFIKFRVFLPREVDVIKFPNQIKSK